MKNFIPNLSKKYSKSFTFARSPHQQRSALIHGGKLASFIFPGLNSRSEQGTCRIIVKLEERETKKRLIFF
jgi:hypothetical protein